MEALYDAWRFYHCLDELRALCEAGHATGRALAVGALARWYLGDHAAAADVLEKTLASDPDVTASDRSRWWLYLGRLRDVLDCRAPALDAYRQALKEEPDAVTREQAQRYLQEPYRE